MMKKVLCFGTFDILHPGHVFLFSESKRLGDHLTVVIARDSTVHEVKGKAPLFGEDVRLAAVASAPGVDCAVLGHPVDKYQVIRDVNPDVICLGYDQQVFVDKLESMLKVSGLSSMIVRIPSYKPEEFKSSIIKAKNGAGKDLAKLY